MKEINGKISIMKKIVCYLPLFILLNGCFLFNTPLPDRGWDPKYIVELPKIKNIYSLDEGIEKFKIAIATDGYSYIKGLKSTEILKDFYTNSKSLESLPQSVFDGLLEFAIKKSTLNSQKKIILRSSIVAQSESGANAFIWQMQIINKQTNQLKWKKTIYITSEQVEEDIKDE